jgi:hypothetical protein
VSRVLDLARFWNAGRSGELESLQRISDDGGLCPVGSNDAHSPILHWNQSAIGAQQTFDFDQYLVRARLRRVGFASGFSED